MKLKKISGTLILFLIIAIGIIAVAYLTDTSGAVKKGFKWNDVTYGSGIPVLSTNMINLDSAQGNQTDWDDKYFTQFHGKTITMGYLYKAPLADTGRIVLLGKTTNNIYYPCDTQKVVGAASYSYTAKSVNLSLLGYAKEYAILYESVADSGANRKNDTLFLSFTPSEVNYVPHGWFDFYNR